MDKSLPDFSGDGKDVFIEYGPGARSLDNARKEEGVAEGVSTSAARGVSGGIETHTSKND